MWRRLILSLEGESTGPGDVRHKREVGIQDGSVEEQI